MIEPETWTLAFYRSSPFWWVRLLALGRYKHVSAFAWVPQAGVWLYYDITLPGTKLVMLPGNSDGTEWICNHTRGADLVLMQRRARVARMPIIAPFCCVPAVRHLVGIPGGALLVTSLFNDCLRHGGEIVHGSGTPTDAEPRTVAPAAAGRD